MKKNGFKPNKKPTLNDIAKSLNISVSSVHKALTGKQGVSEALRKQVVSTAQAIGYSINVKKKQQPIRIAAVFPNPVGIDQYFYQFVWKGLKVRAAELGASLCELSTFTFDGTIKNQIAILSSLIQKESPPLDGVITIVWDEEKLHDILLQFKEKGIRVYTVSADSQPSLRTSHIAIDAYQMGKVAAEYLSVAIHDPGHVILIGTRRDSHNHAHVVRGFYDQLSQARPDIQIIELYESVRYPEKIFDTMREFLNSFEDIRGIYANNARTTAGLYAAALEKPFSKDLVFIGSEAFDQSIAAVEAGIVHALIGQNPFRHGYASLSIAYENIALDKEVASKVELPIQFYLRNNLPHLQNRILH